jgi:hypothetical protein
MDESGLVLHVKSTMVESRAQKGYLREECAAYRYEYSNNLRGRPSIEDFIKTSTTLPWKPGSFLLEKP